MVDREPKVSAVVCTHNGGARLLRVVQALLGLPSAAGAEIVVVDNASTDGSMDPLCRIEDPRLHLVVEPQLGLLNARRTGVEATRAQVIVFVDDDNHLSAQYLEVAKEVMAANPRAGAAGGVAEPVADVPFPRWFSAFANYYACGPQAPESGTMPPASFLRGAGLVVRRESWNQLASAVGELALTGRQGAALTTGDDAEICFALQLLGWELVYDDRLCLQHEMSPSRLNRGYLTRLAYQNGRASAVLDAYVAALIGWRPRPWKRALIREIVPAFSGVPSGLSLACSAAWRAGRIRQIATMRSRYGALPRGFSKLSAGAR